MYKSNINRVISLDCHTNFLCYITRNSQIKYKSMSNVLAIVCAMGFARKNWQGGARIHCLVLTSPENLLELDCDVAL